jgi:hypothetical protein
MLMMLDYDDATVNDLLSSIPHLMKDVGFSNLAGIGAVPSYTELLKEADNELTACWNRSEENYDEFRKLKERIPAYENDILQYKKELDNSRQMLQKLAQKLNGG